MAWGLTSIVVAWAGPFGTFDSQPFGWRLTYWSGLIAAAIVIAIFCRIFWRHLLAGRSEWYEDIAVSVSLAVIFGPMVIALNRFIGGSEAYQAMGLMTGMGVILTIAIGTIALRRALSEPAPTSQSKEQRDRLLNRIAAAPQARLSRISSDNHHIRIVTDDGSEHRILMRLSDAVNETDIEPGVCVHRSHWVAKASVVGVKKVSGRDVVELTCGGNLPVGPKYRENLSFAKDLSA